MEVKTVPEQLMFTTVRIDCQHKDGGSRSGTAFVFEHDYEGEKYLFLVTNKHVVADAKEGGITFILGAGGKPNLGTSHRLDFDSFDSHWHRHPEPTIDICVVPFAPIVAFLKERGITIFFKSVPTSLIPTEEEAAELCALEEIVFIGYPNGIWDEKSFTPIIRRGTTATPIALDYNGEKKFLIDASVFGGSSGSPTFIYKLGTYTNKGTGHVKVGNVFYFVGVVSAAFFKRDTNEIVDLPIPSEKAQAAINNEMIDLGVVLKSATVIEAIEAAIDQLNSSSELQPQS